MTSVHFVMYDDLWYVTTKKPRKNFVKRKKEIKMAQIEI